MTRRALDIREFLLKTSAFCGSAPNSTPISGSTMAGEDGITYLSSIPVRRTHNPDLMDLNGIFGSEKSGMDGFGGRGQKKSKNTIRYQKDDII